jgi:hypothetical protein
VVGERQQACMGKVINPTEKPGFATENMRKY